MTLITAYAGSGTLFMMGDLMMSQSTPVASPPALPGRHSDRFPVTNEYLVGLQQKVFQINPHLAVAWAGNALISRHILREISERLTRPYTGDRVLRFIEELELTDSQKDDVSFIFFMFPETPGDFTHVEVQNYLTKKYPNPLDPTEYFLFSGSGDNHFFQTTAYHSHSSGNATPLLDAMSKFISRAGIAFYNELTSDGLHNKLYGGCFEVLTPGINGFNKIPLLFVIWMRDQNGVALTGPIFIQQYDQDGRLGIRRFMLDQDQTWTQDLFQATNFFHVGKGQFDPNNCPEPLWAIHYVVDREAPHTMDMLQEPGLDKSFKVRLENGRLLLDWRQEFIDRIVELNKGRVG